MQLPRAPYRAGSYESQREEENVVLAPDFTRVRINEGVNAIRGQYEALVLSN